MAESGAGLTGAGRVAAHVTAALASGNANGSGSTSRYTLYFTGPDGSTGAFGAAAGVVTIGSSSSLSGGSSGGSTESKRNPTMPPDGGHSRSIVVSVQRALTNAGGSGVSISGKSAAVPGGPGRPRWLNPIARE